MKQQQHGGSQYGAAPPDTAPFASPGAGPRAQMLGIPSGPDRHHHQHQPAEAASPISSRPPPRPNFDESPPAPAPGSFPDEDALAAGEEVERGGGPGNRWPRQETLALLKIRSEMDAAFRDATLKAPLWDDVSRKLAELGHMRSAKKCKEKFENVHKYYKRTKEGRAGRQDGKSYRFFTELEALHGGGGSIASTTAAMANPTTNAAPALTHIQGAGLSAVRPQTPPSLAAPPPLPPPPPTSTPTHVAPVLPTPIVAPPKIPSSAALPAAADTLSSSFSDSDDEGAEEDGGGASMEGRKRKRGVGKMMAFFEGLMKQVMERQEAMQQRFLETFEKREEDRMVREEAWKRQETARLNREHELMAQEQATAASRDAAVISFLQKMSGQSLHLPPAVAIPAAPPPQPSPPQQHHPPRPPQQQLQHHPAPPPPPQLKEPENHLHRQSTEIVRHQPSTSSTDVVPVPVPVPEPYEVVESVGFEVVTSSRWPKPEVHALIKLRSELDSRYQESGPKGPLWEEISAGMRRLGYSRSSKRCKEKWENINKYFKKVKESNRKRPDDAKTCPYFHQLDALYRQKLDRSGGAAAGGSAFGHQRPHDQETNPNPNPQERSGVLMSMAPPPATQQHPHREAETKKGGNGDVGNPEVQIPTSNGGFPPIFFEEGAAGSATMKKPEDIVKELMEGQHQQSAAMDDYEKLEDPESDSIVDDDDDDDDDDDEDGGKMKYKIEFQRPNVGGGEKSASGSFLAMVQ